MGREVRRVPADWQHPKKLDWDVVLRARVERYIPLLPGENYQRHVDSWDDDCARWKCGWRPDYCTEPADRAMTYEQYEGQRPHKDDYMPDWPENQRTHYMMYEDTSEGTPISPAFATPEELAQWLTDTGASAFGSSTATYDQWLLVAQGSSAPSAVYIPGTGLVSGVQALADLKEV